MKLIESMLFRSRSICFWLKWMIQGRATPNCWKHDSHKTDTFRSTNYNLFFVQINDYWKWEAIFQISIKPQEIVVAFASRNGKFNEGVNKFCTTRSCLANVYHVVGLFWVNWVNSIKPFQQKAWFSIYRHLTFIHPLLTYSLAI